MSRFLCKLSCGVVLFFQAFSGSAQAVRQAKVCNEWGPGVRELGSKELQVTDSEVRLRALRTIDGRVFERFSAGPRLMSGQGGYRFSIVGGRWVTKKLRPGQYVLSLDESYMGLAGDRWKTCVEIEYR